MRYDRTVDRDPSELTEEIRLHIRQAVERRLISDVPFGAFLSGGIDSAAVVAAMAEASANPVKTFSIGFESSRNDELPLARLTAERFGTDHHELLVQPDALAVIPQIVRHYGEPFADTSAVPSFCVAEMARREVTVALNGDGGDESFAGYSHYSGVLRTTRAAGLPAPLRRVVAALGRLSPPRPDPSHPFSRARRLGQKIALDAATRYADAMSVFTTADRRELYSPGFQREIDPAVARGFIAKPWHTASADDPVNRMLEVDVATYLPGDLLVKMDIASMAHSLEARSPLLDHELMEFAATIPGDDKLVGDQKKLALRTALRGWIPDPILDSPKRGFALDTTSDWLRSELRDLLHDTVGEAATARRGYFRPAYTQRLIDLHLAGRADHSPQLWSLMMFELWHREFVDRRPVL